MRSECRTTVVSLTGLLYIALFAPLCGAANNQQTASGSLERVMQQAITIRRSDGVLIDARLPDGAKLGAAALAARYKVGDQVEITCKFIPAVFDETAHLYRLLELTKFRFLRAPSASELASAIASRAWREPGNLLQPPVPGLASKTGTAPPDFTGSPQERQDLERARGVILQYIRNLPNFIADETASRYGALSAPPQWQPLDVIKSVVSFQGATEIRSGVTLQGATDARDRTLQTAKPVEGGFKAVLGLHWGGAFGARLKPIFDPECPVAFKFENRMAGRGMQLLVYSFTSPPDNCFPSSVNDSERFYAGRKGKVFIDEASGNAIELDEASTGFPPRYAFAEVVREVIWDNVKIGDASHLLPIQADEIVRYSRGNLEWVKLQWTNHRHFEAASTITFK